MKHVYHAPEEHPKVPKCDDYDRCLRNMEYIKEFHDDRIGAKAPTEDVGKELERISEHPRIYTPEEVKAFKQHVSKIISIPC